MIILDIKKAVNSAFKKAFSWQPPEIELVNAEPQFGDFALACHPFAKELKLSPQEIAAKLAAGLASKSIAKAEAQAGYLNITVQTKTLGDEVLSAIIKEGRHYGASSGKKEKVLVEYSSPNTNKPLHLGHIRNNILGMAFSNLLELSGNKVVKNQIINDRGIHITKSMVAYQKWGEGKTPEEAGEKGDHFVGRFYVLFEKEFEREWQEYALTQPQFSLLSSEELAKKRQDFFSQSKIGVAAQEKLRDWEAGDKAARELWQKMNSWVYDGFGETYKLLGSHFDKNYYESETYLSGKKIISAGLKKGVFYQEADNSIWIDLTGVGLDKKVLQRSDGTSVYITQDLGLAVARQKEWKFNRAVYVVGHEQEYHFRVLFAILKRLGFKWAANLQHLSYGLVFLPEGKMKSREGKVVDADAIIKEVKALALVEIKKRFPELPESEAHERSAVIGLGALKFFLLRVTSTQAIHYNPAEAIAFEGATGPYVQYAHARIASILKEETPIAPGKIDFAKLGSQEEKVLLLKLLSFPKTVAQATAGCSPNLVCDYLVNLSQAFNSFYHQHQVLRAEDEETKHARLLLIKAVQIVLRNGLGLLGIQAPEKM